MTYQDPVGLAGARAGSSRLKTAITARSVQLIRSRGVPRCSTASWRRGFVLVDQPVHAPHGAVHSPSERVVCADADLGHGDGSPPFSASSRA
jgi:hypothetical protein